jgi:hypothetical protein
MKTSDFILQTRKPKLDMKVVTENIFYAKGYSYNLFLDVILKSIFIYSFFFTFIFIFEETKLIHPTWHLKESNMRH